MGIETFERAVEDVLGEPIEVVRNKTLDERRLEIEKKRKKPLRFLSHFPFIGRGSVLRDLFIEHKKVEKLFEDALRRAK